MRNCEICRISDAAIVNRATVAVNYNSSIFSPPHDEHADLAIIHGIFAFQATPIGDPFVYNCLKSRSRLLSIVTPPSFLTGIVMVVGPVF